MLFIRRGYSYIRRGYSNNRRGEAIATLDEAIATTDEAIATTASGHRDGSRPYFLDIRNKTVSQQRVCYFGPVSC